MNPDLTDFQRNTLQATLNRLIPADDYPSAWEAGCGDYILGQLNGQSAHLADMYRAGLDGIEAEAQSEHDRSFTDLSPEEQDAILRCVENGDTTVEWSTPPRTFFSTIACQTAEGYYADPGQGGNHGKASWKMVGFNGR